jgi:oligoribonuclease (3'-5' exoribonuclease)
MNNQFFLFGDIETGGLNGRLDNGKLGMEYYPIFEVAFIVTNSELQQVGEPLRIAIHHSDDVINRSHEWAIKTHTDSGLLDEVKQSITTLACAEQRVIEWLKSLGVNAYNKEDKSGAIFAGSSIMFDRSYIMCQMPELHEYLHYRQLDVSAIALMTRTSNVELHDSIVSKKEYKHEALADIQESIEEYRAYTNAFFDQKKECYHG